jgi:hypothetical protein
MLAASRRGAEEGHARVDPETQDVREICFPTHDAPPGAVDDARERLPLATVTREDRSVIRRASSIAVLVGMSMLAAACAATAIDPSATPTSPTARPTTSEQPVASPSAAPSQPPDASPSEDPEASPAPIAIAIDGLARTSVIGLRLRDAPGLDGRDLGTLAEGAVSYVVDGPVTADGYAWYLLSGLGLPQASGCATVKTDPWECPAWFGWAAAGSSADAWLEPGTTDCPTWSSDRLTDEMISLQRIAYLACYAGGSLSTVAYFPVIPDDAGLGGACRDVPEALSWIGCNLGYTQVVTDEQGAMLGPGLVLAVDPASVEMPDRGQWVRITGRYDHAAAQDCTYGEQPALSTLYCRAEFVVESAEPVPAP